MFNLTMLDLPFNAEEADDYCRERGLLAKQMYCPTHTTTKMTLYKDRTHGRFRCTRSRCNKSITGTKKSLFEDMRLETHLALGLLFSFSWSLQYDQTVALIGSLRRKSGSSAVDLSPATIASWFGHCREIVVNHFNNMVADLPPIGGPGVIVKIDEGVFGVRKFRGGNIQQGSCVLGMIDQNNNIRMVVVDQSDKATIHRKILKYVAPGSVIHTDSWSEYSGLENLSVNPPYIHNRIYQNDPDQSYIVDEDGTPKHIFNWNRATSRKDKHFFKGRSQFCDEHFADRLCEHMWRRYCRKNGYDIFVALMDAVKAQYPVGEMESEPQ